MLTFLMRRVAAVVPVLVVVGVFVFLVLRLSPGDPAAAVLGDNATPENIAAVRQQLGLNDSLPAQFARWAKHVAVGDLGVSYYMKAPVTTLVSQRVGPTISLAVVTLILTVIIAVPLGVLAAWRHGGWLDRFLMGTSVLGFSVPGFVIGYLLIWLFALHLRWFPVQGYTSIDKGLWEWLSHLVMPAVALSVVYTALIARVTRAAVAEVLTEDFIRTARAKGISEYRVLARHALTNSAIPIVTVIGNGIALLIGGVVVTETVFAIPGMGQLTVDAVVSRDYPVIQGVTLLFSITYVFVNLLVDLSYTLFDPRVRY
ncbi:MULTISPECIES: ABC transporter permease [unclassified Achromobacter]|uniref:ABC transporter permease n=1 Tax=unclassified Achromobacter TaxID=2626865 RepID=UPI000B516695|nr:MULTISPECIES: ABC transporter permease [unclassified Achromobacter]OWT73760.1 peptide ABC transporter [Achromobacter sp. HZ34]OWT79325.1 peptide ABC transporter [Achromobacter sp. HZ28]